jgi:hypothetical protein
MSTTRDLRANGNPCDESISRCVCRALPWRADGAHRTAFEPPKMRLEERTQV